MFPVMGNADLYHQPYLLYHNLAPNHRLIMKVPEFLVPEAMVPT